MSSSEEYQGLPLDAISVTPSQEVANRETHMLDIMSMREGQWHELAEEVNLGRVGKEVYDPKIYKNRTEDVEMVLPPGTRINVFVNRTDIKGESMYPGKVQMKLDVSQVDPSDPRNPGKSNIFVPSESLNGKQISVYKNLW